MRELEELTIEIIKKHLASNKKIGYDWDIHGYHYILKTGFFSSIHIGSEEVVFHTLFNAIPIHGDFSALREEVSKVREAQRKIKLDKRDAMIIRWLKMQK